MLAMVMNDNAGNQMPRGVLRFFASVLTPTGTLLVISPANRDVSDC